MPGLSFFSNNTLEPINNPDADGKIIARNALKLLTMGWQKGVLHHFMYWRVFKAIFVKRDKALMRDLRAVFQEGFDRLFYELNGNDTSPEIEMHLSACLSLLSIADLRPDEWIRIPQYITSSTGAQGQWMQIRYRVTPIELTPTTGLESCFLSEVDRAFAYALDPFNGESEDAASHLIFPSTTYLAGRGFLSHIRADLEAFETSGTTLYLNARDKIHIWLKEHGREGVYVHGHSLGGSHVLLTVADMAKNKNHNIKGGFAFNPEGMYKPFFLREPRHYENWGRQYAKRPPLTVMQNIGDPISAFGHWPESTRLYKIIPPAEQRGSNAILDHGLLYSGVAEVQFTLLDVDEENKNPDRQWRNLYLNTLLRGLFYYAIFLPYYYLIHPPLRLIVNNKALSTALGGALFVFLAQVGYVSVPAWAPIMVGLLTLGMIGLKLMTIFTTDLIVETTETYLNVDNVYPPPEGNYPPVPEEWANFALQF